MADFFTGAFLYNPKNNTVLLHKRDMKVDHNPGLWAFFGGSSEGDETPQQTIVRELKEEIGVDVRIDQLIPLITYFNEKYKRQSFIFYVISSLEKSEMKLGEGEDFDWVPLGQVFNYKLTESSERSLKELQRLVENNEILSHEIRA